MYRLVRNLVVVNLLINLTACASLFGLGKVAQHKPPDYAAALPVPSDLYDSIELETALTEDLVRPISKIKEPEIIVFKQERRLEVIDQKTKAVVRKYKVGLGPSPSGDKIAQGDGRTPEGSFYVCKKNPGSRFRKSLWVSYPSPKHATEALKHGLIGKDQFQAIVSAAERKEMPPMKTKLGGLVALHGGGGMFDWTLGCVALNDKDIDELYQIASVGTKIVINP